MRVPLNCSANADVRVDADVRGVAEILRRATTGSLVLDVKSRVRVERKAGAVERMSASSLAPPRA